MDEHSMDTDTVWNNPCFQVQIKPCEVHILVHSTTATYSNTTTALATSAQFVSAQWCSVIRGLCVVLSN